MILLFLNIFKIFLHKYPVVYFESTTKNSTKNSEKLDSKLTSKGTCSLQECTNTLHVMLI